MIASRISRSVIGVDVGSRSFKAIQLRRAGRRWAIQSAVRFPRLRPGQPLDAEEVRRLRAVLRRRRFSGRKLSLAVPDDDVISDILELPPRKSGAPVEQIARVELSRIHDCDPNAFEMACWDLPPVPGKNIGYVLAVGCSHKPARSELELFESAGFDVQTLDIRGCAIARACEHARAPADAVTMILDLGWTGGNLMILHQDTLIYQRQTGECGVGLLATELRQQFHLEAETVGYLLDYEEVAPVGDRARRQDVLAGVRQIIECHFDRVVAELQPPLTYANRQYPKAELQRLLLVGGGASLPGIAPYLADRMELDVRAVGPVNLAACPTEMLRNCGPYATAAMGLAMSPERAA